MINLANYSVNSKKICKDVLIENLLFAIIEDNLETVKHLIKEFKDNSDHIEILFMVAIKFGRFEILKYIVEEKGANIYFNNYEAFKIALQHGQCDIFNYLYTRSVEENKIYEISSDEIEKICRNNLDECLKTIVSINGQLIYREDIINIILKHNKFDILFLNKTSNDEDEYELF